MDAAMPAQTGLFLQDLSYAEAGRPILSGITAHLTEQRIGIVGRNGSGKTTLLRVMAGLVRPTTGQVRLDGIDPAGDRRAVIRRLGLLFQNPDHQIIFPTVEEEIAFGLRQQGRSGAEALAQARAVLAAEGRAHWAGAPVHRLSQGQRQYLCLMAVLAMEPATILLDEPFAALDLPTKARLARRLDGLPQRLVIISHDPATLARVDRVLWLEGGQLHLDGPAAQVLAAFSGAMDRAGALDADIDIPR
ncbi:MAG: ABC transporter ATP-binding protein [Rhodobacter sp.]|nr:ABC transporter ATP-binding protein [Rhodobacter sp.]MCA3520987.1 ABC transporter ATP-binding protein [Rhodobacter sp.]MCA3523883.1 ABC transporter ATP-binding protein [Rhodobacter sp.]MCA3526311.1 ABC transporter ATP-binding protein [Rhodobacter sp.]MCA3529100.1 ABC transporter ATP-binding protein [Rhodobacter sp.]